ncbi:MAG: hypothetical protein ABEJ83_05395 [Candidatus Nanohaloarchaea archaeon]
MDKPVFVVAAVVLALMFVALYYGAVTGWLEGMVRSFTGGVERVNVTSTG